MLAHKAVHEAHVAAEVIAGELQGNKELASTACNARVVPNVAYTDPEVAWVGLTETETEAKAQGTRHKAQGIKVSRYQGQKRYVPLDSIGLCHCQQPKCQVLRTTFRRLHRQ